MIGSWGPGLTMGPGCCLACDNLLADGERDLCEPCAAVMGEDLAQRDKAAGNPGSRCSDACGHCGRCGGE
jgi:hypothetical protein